jgi:hypothetical protein
MMDRMKTIGEVTCYKGAPVSHVAGPPMNHSRKKYINAYIARKEGER